MLLYSLLLGGSAVLLGCSAEAPPPAPGNGPERKHHVERTDRPAEGEERDADAEPVTFGGGNRPPIVRMITISPTKPTKLSTMTVKVNATDPEGQPLKYAYHWRVNGSEVFGHDDAAFDLADTRRDDTVEVSVQVSDGTDEVKGQSELYTIGNADPQILKVPGVKDRFDGLEVTAQDPDGDDVTWRLEGAPAGASIDSNGRLHYAGTQGEKGGDYTVKVLAEDGHGGKGTLELPLSVSPGSQGKPPPPGVPK